MNEKDEYEKEQYEKEQYEKVNFKINEEVLVKLYSLDQKIHKCIYKRFVTYEQNVDGYRPGLIAEYMGHEHWVLPYDVNKII